MRESLAMTVRSFAQNFEDVLLRRALRDVEDGRYVDVGAGHPTHHSVTKLFYDAGWSGINVEPLPGLAQRLVADRPRDVTVHAAVTSQPVEEIELTVVDSWDELSTTSTTRAEAMREEGRALSTVRVPVARLDDLLSAQQWPDLHFLKIDVEGAELEVLRTIDLGHTRPWVVLLEVVAGGTEASQRDDIRRHMEDAGYVHAWFDGLNDFFVAKEHSERLLPSFKVPVNITDDFVIASENDRVMVDVIGERLGLPAPAQASEVLQRVDGVIRDRVEFERLHQESERRLADLETARRELEENPPDNGRADEVRRLELKIEAMEQTTFERERLVAWYAAELNNQRYRAHVAQQDFVAASSRAESAEHRFADVMGSTSWRYTLPIRAARRPRTYLKRLLQR
jgi:FkbM family methyltransferase